MRSCLYEGVVQHRRLAPVEHSFRYRLFLVYVDLAELDSLFGRRGVWSTHWPALARFRRDDYLGDPARPLEQVGERHGFQISREALLRHVSPRNVAVRGGIRRFLDTRAVRTHHARGEYREGRNGSASALRIAVAMDRLLS